MFNDKNCLLSLFHSLEGNNNNNITIKTQQGCTMQKHTRSYQQYINEQTINSYV